MCRFIAAHYITHLTHQERNLNEGAAATTERQLHGAFILR